MSPRPERRPLTPGARIALFGVGLVAAGLLGAGVGAAVGPIDVGGEHEPAPAEGGHDGGDGHDDGERDETTTTVDHDGHDGSSTSTGDHDGGAAEHDGHDLDDPFEVPTLETQEDGS